MPLYYIKSLQELADNLDQGEVTQGSNLSNTLSSNPEMFADESNVDRKLLAAQDELEMILASIGFPIPVVRTANNNFLNMCVAVFCWWNMEINGEGREIIEKRRREYVKLLQGLTVILKEDGTAIYPVDKQSADTIANKRNAPLVADRSGWRSGREMGLRGSRR